MFYSPGVWSISHLILFKIELLLGPIGCLKPKFKCDDFAQAFLNYRYNLLLTQFLMTLRDDFEFTIITSYVSINFYL